MKKEYIVPAIAVIALLLGLWSLLPREEGKVVFPLGAAGTLLAENYIPYVTYNDGYASENEITTSGLLESTGTFTVGANGSAFAELKAATCNLTGMDISQTASTTASYDCAVTGVASGDVVMAQLSTTTKNANILAWFVTSAIASSTAGNVTVRVYNQTGADAIPSVTAVGSSTNVWYGDI